MDAGEIEKLSERLKEERNYSRTTPFSKGVGKGKIDVSNFTYSQYKKLRAIFERYETSYLKDFRGDEPEIRELYDSFRQRCGKRTIRVEVEKLEGGDDFQGTYNIAFSEDVMQDLLDQIAEKDQPKFLHGWISGVTEIAKQLDV